MRHFLLLPTIFQLAGGMLAPPIKGALVGSTRPMQRLPPCLRGASIGTINLTPIAVATDKDGLPTASTTVHPQRRQLPAQPAAAAACRPRVDVAWFPVEGRGSCQGSSLRRGRSCTPVPSLFCSPGALPQPRGPRAGLGVGARAAGSVPGFPQKLSPVDQNQMTLQTELNNLRTALLCHQFQRGPAALSGTGRRVGDVTDRGSLSTCPVV